MARKERPQGSIPYLPFTTFNTSLDDLESQKMPHRIDRSIWMNQAGGTQSLLIAALKFMGVIDDEGTPIQPLLSELAQNGTRQAAMKQIIQERFLPALGNINLERSTPKQLTEAFSSLGIKGDTLRKAVSFFIQAIVFAEVPISPTLLNGIKSMLKQQRKAARAALAGKERTKEKSNGISKEAVGQEIGNAPAQASASGNIYQVALESGGSLGLMLSVDFVNISVTDRQFVFEMIDKMKEYQRKTPQGASKEV